MKGEEENRKNLNGEEGIMGGWRERGRDEEKRRDDEKGRR